MASVTVDASGWTQDQKNLTEAAVVSLLFKNNITHGKIVVSLPIITVENPSPDDLSSLTTASVLSEVNAIIAAAETARQASEAEDLACANEKVISELANIKLSQVDARIDAISNLNEMKTFMKKFVRFMVANLRGR